MLSIGGDRAPGSGTAFLVSFLHCGKRVASSSENYLLFGANVDENSEFVKLFLKELVSDLIYLESKVFDVKGKKVEFKSGELPNDMKMLSFLAGELSNSTTYFLTFANICQKEANDFRKKFGLTKHYHWLPWSYEKRITDSEKVLLKKKEFSKCSKLTIKNKVTSFIAETLQGRQKFKPIVGSFINVAKPEPLHLQNNTIKEQFMKLLKICMAKTEFLGAKTLSAEFVL